MPHLVPVSQVTGQFPGEQFLLIEDSPYQCGHNQNGTLNAVYPEIGSVLSSIVMAPRATTRCRRPHNEYQARVDRAVLLHVGPRHRPDDGVSRVDSLR